MCVWGGGGGGGRSNTSVYRVTSLDIEYTTVQRPSETSF